MGLTINRHNNMGMVRYILALAVIVHHFNVIFGTNYWLPVSSYHAVGGFFALSGFLVYGSYRRSPSLGYYTKKRARKILPPYFFIIAACAILLYFTTDPDARQNYISAQWLKYVACNAAFLNFLCPDLPGVFENNPLRAVNASLWTMKVEWLLYLSVPVTVWFVHKTRWHSHKVITAIYLLSCSYRLWLHHLYDVTGNEFYYIFSRQVLGQLSYFYAGVAIYMNYDRFMRHKQAIIAICIALLCSSGIIPYYAYFIEPMVIPALVIWFSMVGKWGAWGGINDNISYEIYLFHWPIIQLAWQYRNHLCLPPALMLVFVIVSTAALGCACWFSFGKRILHGKPKPGTI
ncbi:acyltransferase [Muribaculum caecicola]|uniref:Acyltransferase n=1 Tax=Muribaculum caecicola TaxID=3038144 RepID=A0AC61S7Y9_9BACT|nr:acyltransferase [Muribaculum caecicola]THG54992.1 acyltransferase [Muribaculum caecicola]